MTALAALAFALVLSACGSSSSSSSSTKKSTADPTQSGASPSLTAANATLAKYSKLPASLGLTPVGKPIPTGKKVVYIGCIESFCSNVNVGLKAATKVLGWSETQLVPQYTPQATISAWNQALNLHPNVIVTAPSFPASVIRTQLAQAKSQGIVVVAQSASGYTIGPSGELAANNQGQPDQVKAGQLMADVAIQNAGGKPDVALVIDPTIPLDQTVIGAFKQAVQAAGGTYSLLSINDNNVGRTVPAQVVAYLQSHPDTKYLAMFNDFEATGVPQALLAANLHVKMISGVSDLPDISLVKNGTWIAAIFEQQYEAGWALMNEAVRSLVGASMTQYRQPTGTFLVLTKQNLSLGTPNIRSYPYANSQFIKAWGK